MIKIQIGSERTISAIEFYTCKLVQKFCSKKQNENFFLLFLGFYCSIVFNKPAQNPPPLMNDNFCFLHY